MAEGGGEVNLALNQLGLGFVFTARDQATRTIQRVGNAFDRQATRVRLSSGIIQGAAIGLGASLATMAAGLGTLRGAFNIARDAGTFEQNLARVQAVTQATGEELGLLRNRAIQAGIETQFSPQEAVEGLGELGVRGFQARESIAALGGVLDFAAGGQVSVAQGAQTVGAALRVFSLQADDATLAADRLLRISNLTALQGNELALALGNVSRGAGLTDQNMNEMLISMGLVRNTGVEASVAASGVSSALIFMTRNARDIQQQLGVSVTETLADGTTAMRDFNDVILEASEAAGERFPDAAERGAVFSRLFGRFGLTAANAIGRQLAAGVRNANGEIVRGAEALAYMRDTMDSAEGTAARFRETLLDTFEGQITLLQGTVQTLRVVLGESLAQAMRPFVAALTATLNFFIRVVEAIPGPVKSVIGAIVIGIGALLTAFGGLGAIGFAVALIIPFLKVIAITMGVVLLATLPVIAAIGALVVAVVTLYHAFRMNLGGIADFARRVWGQISLGFRALRELFSRGGFSKEVSAELGRAENQGLRRFVINVFALWARLRRFLTGVRQGFTEAFKAGAPAVRALVEAIRRLGRQLGWIDETADDIAGGSMRSFAETGAEVGRVVGRGLVIVVDVIRNIVQYWQGLVSAFQDWGPTLSRLGSALAESFGRLGAAFREAFGMQEEAAGQGRTGQSVMRDLGEVVGNVLVPALILLGGMLGATVEAIAFVVGAGNWLMRNLRSAFVAISGFINRQINAWLRFKATVIDTIDTIAGRALVLVRMLPQGLRERFGLGGVEQALANRAQAQTNRTAVAAVKAARRRGAEGVPAAAQPAVAEAEGAGARGEAAGAAFREQMLSTRAASESMREAVGALRLAAAQPINIQIDGETIARATRGGERSASAGEFAPVGVED